MITCFEINDRECKIVTLSESKGQVYVNTAVTLTFPETDKQDEKTIKIKSDMIKDAVKKYGIKTDVNILLIPKQSVTVRHVSLPSSNDEEITQMARFEAERHIPFNVERHIISHHLIVKEGVSGSKVLIAAVDSPIIEDFMLAMKGAGISIDAADVSSLSLFNAYLLAKPNLQDDVTTALIHIDGYKTEVTLVRKNCVIYTRSVLHGIIRLFKELEEVHGIERKFDMSFLNTLDLFLPEKSFPELLPSHPAAAEHVHISPSDSHQQVPAEHSAEPGSEHPVYSLDHYEGAFNEKRGVEESTDVNPEILEYKPDPNNPARKVINAWLTKLIQEIRRTYEFAKREFDCPKIDKIVISGDITRCQTAVEYFHKNIGVEVMINQCLNALKFHPKSKINTAETDLSSYVETIGGAARELIKNTIRINILPKVYIEKKSSTTKKRHIMWVCLFSVFALILAGIYLRNISDSRKSDIAWYEATNKKNAEKVDMINDMEKKLRIIKKEVDSERSSLAILDKISTYSYIPSRVAITEFNYISSEEVTIRGHALEIPDLNVFLADLEKSGFFKKVMLKQRGPTDLSYRPVKIQSFEIKCFFEIKKDKKR